MLIRFRVSNYLSFKEEAEFSMVAGKVHQHPEQVVRKTGNQGVDLLRAAMIYGANDSGKSNLVKAIDFARFMITEGVRAKSSIPRKPFKLDEAFSNQPSKFEFEIQISEKIFVYGFKLDNKRVQEEWLREVRASSEKDIFYRVTASDEVNQINFGIKVSKKEKDLLELVAQTTSPNRLFLQECVERNIKHFSNVYEWFEKSLVIIYPSSYHSLSPIGSGSANTFSDSLVKYLEHFSTGICGYSLQSIKDPSVEIPPEILEKLGQELDVEHGATVITPDNQRFFIKKEAEQIKVSKLLLSHRDKSSGSNILFEMEDESDGTLRLLDLIPTLFPMKNQRSSVIIIDELDRSLHPSLSYEFLSLFLKQTTNKQLIVTTHEANLLDLDLIRRDEIWFVEKNAFGASTVYSLEEFSPRYDKDIRKGYILGRFGAIPMLGHPNF